MLFAPPKVIETTVFARLPDEFQRSDHTNEWVATQPLGSPHRSLLEGPSFDREGNLWCVNIPGGQVFKVTSEGAFKLVAQYDGWPNGLKIHPDGRVFIADYKHGIMVLDPVTGKVAPLLVRWNAERFKGVNDLFFAANGDLYFTDQGLTGMHDATGRVFRLSASGKLTCLVDTIPSPNGLVMNKDETALFVAVTRGNCVWRVPFLANGDVAKVGVFVQLSGGGGPDGMALDNEGRLLVAHVGMGSVWVFDRVGEPVYRIKSCAGHFTTNVAFGGPEGKTLYITESETGSLLIAELDVPGKPMYSHASAA